MKWFHRNESTPEPKASPPEVRHIVVEMQKFVKNALDPGAKKQAESIYRRHFTKHFADPLKAHGFRRHGSTMPARVMGDALYQFLSFQKSSMMNKMFRVSVALRPLYIPKEFLSRTPGHSLRGLAGGGHDWWEYWTEEQAAAHFPQIQESIECFALPWFDRLMTTEDLLQAWDQDDETVKSSAGPWRLRDHAFMLLRVGRLEEALEEFENARRAFSEVKYDWAKRAAEACETQMNVISQGQEAVTAHLQENETAMREKWKLVGW